MHRQAAPLNPAPYRYPSGFWRMSDYTCNHAAVSRRPATAASGERLLAEFAAHSSDSEIMRHFQRMLRVTIDDWQRTDNANTAAKALRR